MYRSPVTEALVPSGVVTEVLCRPAASAGVTAVSWVEETTLKLVAATEPKATFVAPVKPVPVIVTVVPPAVVPEVGETLVMAGAGVETIGAKVTALPLVSTAAQKLELGQDADTVT